MRPTYIFAGNIILVTFECIGLGKIFNVFDIGHICDNGLNTHLGKRKNLILKLFVRWPKIIEFCLRIQMLPAKLASL